MTALKSNGFYMQDSVGDGDTTTSDGIFVFTGSAPTVAVGDAVSVRGRVQEFHGSTEITGVSGQPVSVTVVSSGNPPIAAYDLSTHAPSHDPTPGVCANAAINSQTQGYQANNFACLDGMLVTVSNGLAVTPTSGSLSYSTTPVSDGVHANNVVSFYATADGTRPFRSPGIDWPGDASRPDIPVYSDAPEAFEIFYAGLGFNPAGYIYNAGTKFHTTGIMSGFSSSTTGGIATLYELYPTTMTTDSTPTYPVVVATAEPGKLTVGTQNMLHFFNNRNDGSADSSQYTDNCNGDGSTDQCPTLAEYNVRLQKMSKQIRLTLKAPVVQVVQELENYGTLVDLANQIHSDDPTISYVPYSIRSNDPGGINIGILVRDTVIVNSVTQFFRDTRVNDACSSGSNCLLNDRPPVLLDATYQGYRFRVLAIYDRSLGSLAKNNYVGRKRMEQAVQIAGLVNALQHTGQSAVGNTQQVAGGTSTDGTYAISGDDNIPVVVLGDFNAYEFSDGFVDVTGLIMGTAVTSNAGPNPCPTYYCPTNPMDVGTYTAPSPALVDTGTAPDPNGAYSYTFNAYAQEIDHIVITARAQQDFVRISHAHGNADTTDSADTSNAYGAIMLDPTTAMHTSDHDGQVVTLGHVVTPVGGGGNGTWTPSTPQTASSATTLVFTLSPAPGYTGGATDTCGPGGTSAGSFNAATNQYTLPAGITVDCVVAVQLKVFVDPLSHGSVDSAPHSVAYNGTTTFTFTPDTGYHFGTVSDNCGNSGAFDSVTGKYTTGAITHDCTVDATFVPNTYNVSANVTGGTVDAPSKNADFGTTASFTFTPNVGFRLVSASDTCGTGGSYNAGTGVYTTGPVTADCSVSVVFSNTYTVSASVVGAPNGHGTAGPTPQSVTFGNTATFTLTPATGYHVASASDDCGSGPFGGGTTYTTAAITHDCSVTVQFFNDTEVLTYTVDNPTHGSISGATTQSVLYGANGTAVTAVPAVGYHFVKWSDNSTTNPRTDTNVTANISVTAIFGVDYVPLSPARLMDTRPGFTTIDGISAGEGALAVGETRTLKVTNRGGIPNTAISAVAFNLVAVNPAGVGYITIWSGNGPVPNAGNLNLNPGLTIPNLVVSQVNASGEVSIYNGGTTAVDLTVNLQGYFPAETTYVAMSALRFLDTRPGFVTVDHQDEATGPIPSATQFDLAISGRASIPATGVGAVILNVTDVNPTNVGYVTVWPHGFPLPNAANLNLNPGHTTTHLVIAKVGSDGYVSIYNGGLDPTDIVANVQGWFPETSSYTGLTPARLLDTRAGSTTIDHQNQAGGALAAGGQMDLTVTNRGGVPLNGVGAVVLKVTVVNPTNVGYLTVWPTGEALPTAGNLNLNPGITLSNVVIAKVGANGKVSIYSGGVDPTDIVIDVQGYFPGTP